MSASSLATNKQFSVEESTDFKSEDRNKTAWKKKNTYTFKSGEMKDRKKSHHSHHYFAYKSEFVSTQFLTSFDFY